MFDCKCLGAIDAETKRYVRPNHAVKGVQYSCIECDGQVIFKCGKIKRPHFAHKPGSLCSYYNRCNESQMHKEAKLGLRQYLSDGNVVTIFRNCTRCKETEKALIKCEKNETVVCEYVASDKCRYDVCILDSSNNPRCVLEVQYTHKTASYRPEPWYELDALQILLGIEKSYITMRCGRRVYCDKCELDNKIISTRLYLMIPCSKYSTSCLMCKKYKDPYIVANDIPISVCNTCIWGDLDRIVDHAKRFCKALELKKQKEKEEQKKAQEAKMKEWAREQEEIFREREERWKKEEARRKEEAERRKEEDMLRLKEFEKDRDRSMFEHIDRHIEEWSKLGMGHRCVCGIMFPDNFWRSWHQKRCNVYLNQKPQRDDASKSLKITSFFKVVS
jgi:hypothetical protein